MEDLSGTITAKGRFRVESSDNGAPVTNLGRFRLIPQAGEQGRNGRGAPQVDEKKLIIDIYNIPGAYATVASPSMQRGRFAVIPEEPNVSGSPVTNTSEIRRSPSPDWDFDEEDKTVSRDFPTWHMPFRSSL